MSRGGLVFSGEFVHRIHEILPVQEIMDRLSAQLAQALALPEPAVLAGP